MRLPKPAMTPKIDPALHRDKKPDWIRVTLPRDPKFWSTKGLITDLKLHTVCEEAQCPNRWECWSQGTATFMIAGDRCTRACGFCAVKTAKPFALEADEPKRVAEAAEKMNLRFLGINWLSSQIQAVNAIMILAFIPLHQYVIYPLIDRVFPLTPLRKIGLGLIVTGLSFFVSAWIETQIAAGLKPSIGWQLPAYALLSAGEVMVDRKSIV